MCPKLVSVTWSLKQFGWEDSALFFDCRYLQLWSNLIRVPTRKRMRKAYNFWGLGLRVEFVRRCYNSQSLLI